MEKFEHNLREIFALYQDSLHCIVSWPQITEFHFQNSISQIFIEKCVSSDCNH